MDHRVAVDENAIAFTHPESIHHRLVHSDLVETKARIGRENRRRRVRHSMRHDLLTKEIVLALELTVDDLLRQDVELRLRTRLCLVLVAGVPLAQLVTEVVTRFETLHRVLVLRRFGVDARVPLGVVMHDRATVEELLPCAQVDRHDRKFIRRVGVVRQLFSGREGERPRKFEHTTRGRDLLGKIGRDRTLVQRASTFGLTHERHLVRQGEDLARVVLVVVFTTDTQGAVRFDVETDDIEIFTHRNNRTSIAAIQFVEDRLRVTIFENPTVLTGRLTTLSGRNFFFTIDVRHLVSSLVRDEQCRTTDVTRHHRSVRCDEI